MRSESPLRPRELVPLLALVTDVESANWTQVELSQVSGQTQSQVNRTLARAAKARLYNPEQGTVLRRNLAEFLHYGVRYAFFAEPGPLVEGVPTGAACPAFEGLFAAPEQPLVWPSEEGSTFGQAVEPLHSGVPGAALRNSPLYALLAAVDCMRLGGARERAVASEFLAAKLLDREDHLAWIRKELGA